jgi:hypothetical protein
MAWPDISSMYVRSDLDSQVFLQAENMLYWETDDIGATLKLKTSKYITFLSCTAVKWKLRHFTYIEVEFTGKSFSEALILTSTNPQYDKRLFIESPVQYMKIPSLEHVVYSNLSNNRVGPRV